MPPSLPAPKPRPTAPAASFNGSMEQIPVPSGLLACLLLFPLRGQDECRKQAGRHHRGRWAASPYGLKQMEEIVMKPARCLVLILFVFIAWVAQPLAVAQEMDAPRPIAGVDSVFMEELTWMEVRDAIRSGKTTALVATGGVEQNGPYVATGKHNYVLQATTEAIARKLGTTLVAPIIKFVPEGDIEPPTDHG